MAFALSFLLGLAVPVALVAWLVHAIRQGHDDDARPGMSLRRLLQYGFLLAAVCTAAVGLSGLLELALPAERLAGRASTDLALGLSLSIVAVPVTAGLWRVVRRRIHEDDEERGSTAWSLYLAAAATVAVTITLVELVRVGGWAVAGDPFSPSAVARAAVWGAVWVAHLRVIGHPRHAPTATGADLSWLAGSAVGLLALVAGTGSVLFLALDQLYAALLGGVLVAPDSWLDLRYSAVVAVLGAGLWWWEWLRHASRKPRTTLWYGYVLWLPILGGLLASVGSAATVLHAVLQWTVGVPDTDVAVAHFAVVPGAVAVGVMGGWAWGYHRLVLGEVAARRRTEPERAYEYVGAAVGLVAASAGVAIALVALIETLAPAPLAAGDAAGRAVLVTAVTFLVVGGPLWWAFWRRLAEPPNGAGVERASPSRRAYLFLLFGAAGLTAVVSLMVTIFVVLRDAFDGILGGQTVLDIRVGIALTLTAGALSAYHWTVYREDRDLRPDTESVRDQHVLLVAAEPGPLAERLRQSTGTTVRVLHRLDARVTARDTAADAPADGGASPDGGESSAADPEAVAQVVADCPHPRVLVLVDGADVRVVPYRTG